MSEARLNLKEGKTCCTVVVGLIRRDRIKDKEHRVQIAMLS